MQTFQYGFTCLLLVLFSKTAQADLGAGCANDGECDALNNEVCDTNCICDGNNGYKAGPVTTTSCFQAVNLAATCTTADECLLGNGGSGTICTGATPDCQCDTGNSYVEDASTCKIDCGAPTNLTGYTLTLVGAGATATLETAEAAVACATGYTGTPANVACETGGSWATPTGCTIANCGALTPPTNGAVDSSPGITYGKQATYSCNTGFSLSGNAQVLCKADGTWETAPTCPVTDCGEPPNETGYTASKDGGTTYQETATVVCDSANGWSGTAANISCEASGSWTSYSGCSGASEIRQNFSLVVLIVALVIALM